MRYRKIKKGSLHTNSDQNRLLRQQWAIKFIQLWEEGYVFLNIDESWLSYTDHRRMKWQVHGTTNSLATKALVPRVSVILAIDSIGRSYLSLMQANSNSTVMSVYLRELSKLLDESRPGWRDNTILLLDGASYHQSRAT